MKNNDRIKSLFAAHPGHDTVYVTSDGMPFFNRMAAGTHAASRKDKTLTTITRSECFAPEVVAEEVPVIPTAEELAAKAAAEAEAKARAMASFNQFNGIEPNDNTGTSAADATAPDNTKVDENAADTTDSSTEAADADAKTEESDITNPIADMTNAEVKEWAEAQTSIEALQVAYDYSTTKGGREALSARIAALTPAE